MIFSKFYFLNSAVLLKRTISSYPELSSVIYGTVRKPFAPLSNDSINFFKNVLNENRVLTNIDDVMPYNIDWFRDFRGQSQVVLKPKNTEEVSKLVSYCNNSNHAISVYGGNTGLVGGCTPVFDEVVLSLELMDKIISIDATSGTLVCEAGCVLEKLENELNKHQLIMPIDLGAKGSCQIGGNVSTNAGGIRLLRYGNLHGNVLGLEAVKADGVIVDCLRTLKKDNTGYHLKHLFIGSEGTLGIVTKVAIQCAPLPKAVNLAFLGAINFENVLTVFKMAKESLGEIISAFEMADDQSLEPSFKFSNVSYPIMKCPFYVILETNGSNEIHDNEKLSKFLDVLMEKGVIVDGTVTDQPSKMRQLWSVRENIPHALQRQGHFSSYDVSLPLESYYQIVPKLREQFGPTAITICGFGHIGDSNIHINLTREGFDEKWLATVEDFIYGNVSSLNGSISAEHGIGYRKPNYIHFSKSQGCINLMKQMKNMMDPKGILNPYKMLPEN